MKHQFFWLGNRRKLVLLFYPFYYNLACLLLKHAGQHFYKGDKSCACGAHLLVKMMTDLEQNQIKQDFLDHVGTVIRKNRERKCISQESLAKALALDRTTISRYENGQQDIPTGLLPLFSIYCDFYMSDYIEEDFDKRICEGFRRIVNISANRYKRKEQQEKQRNGREQVGKIYRENGIETREYFQKKKSKSFSQMLLEAEIPHDALPLSEKEFLAYVKSKDLQRMIVNSGDLLGYMEHCEKRETIKNMIAEGALRDLFVDNFDQSDTELWRMYMYYRELFMKCEVIV